MVSYPLIKEGQLSHKYAIASPVEPMNLLSKGSNDLLPKYRSTKWKNGLVPPCSILLQNVIQSLEQQFDYLFKCAGVKLISCWDLKEHYIIIIIIKNQKGKISIEFPQSLSVCDN